MLKLIVTTALVRSPVALLLGFPVFLLFQWGLRNKYKPVQVIAKTFLGFTLLICAGGVCCGVLRFTGMILFEEDNFRSYNWFGASYRDDGFTLIYLSCTVMIGGLLGLHHARKQLNADN